MTGFRRVFFELGKDKLDAVVEEIRSKGYDVTGVVYGSNSWAYTRLGQITDKTASELEELLGKEDVTIDVSLQ